MPQKAEYSKNIVQNIYGKIYIFKEYIQNLIKSSMDDVNANVAISMIYGDRTDLDEEVEETFENIGISHLMSVSGTHITSFMFVVNILFRIRRNDFKENKDKKKNKTIKKKIQSLIQIISICFYIVFTGFSVSVIRAGVMLIITIVCDLFNITKNKYKSLVITLLLILLGSPYAIFNTGLRLSVLATLGIIMFNKYIVKLFENITRKIKIEALKKLIMYLIENIAITISVQLMIIPIQIQSFNKLPFPVIIPNLLLGIISTPIRIIGMVGIMLSFVPKLACKIFSFVELFVEILLYLAKLFKSISFSISTVSMPLMFFVLYYILVICIFGYLKLKNIYKTQSSKYNFENLLKYLKYLQIILFGLLITIVVSLNIYSIYFSEYVYYFNVEQGDMSYIKSGKESIIVDIGSLRQGLAFNTILNYFKMSNLKSVDYIIVSHMHKDHINGLESFLQEYTVGTVIYAKPKTISDAYTQFKALLKKYNIDSREVRKGDKFVLGKFEIEILLPGNKYIEGTDEVNTNSLVCKIKINNKSLLYMGDASIEAEQELIKQKIDIDNTYILKVGHHGSKTATSEEFIQKTKPQYAVISALKKYYGHPHEVVTQVLEENNVYINLTERQGAIKFNLK